MIKILLAGAGGFVGSVLRYSVASFVQGASGDTDFPYGTLAVNLLGCLAIGFLAELAEARGIFTTEARILVFVGVLGGFTTFSAFGNETINLWRANHTALGLINVAAQVVLCLGAVWISRLAAHQIWK